MKQVNLTKWLFMFLLMSAFMFAVSYTKPTPAKGGTIPNNIKRADEDSTINSIDGNNKWAQTKTPTITSTATATSANVGTATASESNVNQPVPTVIPNGTPDWEVAVYGTESGISSRMAALGAILIVLGLFLCGMGYRMVKTMLAVMGLLTFGLVSWIALANCRPENGYSGDDTVIMIVIPVCIGIIGALLYSSPLVMRNKLYYVYPLYLVNAFGMFVFAVFICSWKSDLVIANPIGRYCFLGGMALLGGALAYFSLHWTTLSSTSFIGAYIFMFGIDCLARRGLIAGFEALFNRNKYHSVEYVVSTYVYVMLAMIIPIFILSVGWQTLVNTAHRIAIHIGAALHGNTVAEEEKHDGNILDEHHPRDPNTAPAPAHE